MSFYNKDKNPFPFYPLEGEVWTNTKPLWFSTNCTGCCYDHILYPGVHYFQLPIPLAITNPAQITDIDLRKVSDNTILASDIDGTVYLDASGKKYLLISVTLLPEDVGQQLYVAVVTEFQRYYSEMFCLAAQTNDLIQIDWAIDEGKMGSMVYADDFRHRINIKAVILPTEPQIEEETVEDGYGNEQPTLQVLKQGFFFSCVLPNFIAQAISAIPMHNQYNIINRIIGDVDAGFDPEIKSITVKVTPEEDGCYSFVEFDFVKETIIKTTCTDHIVSFDNTFVSIVWNDTDTTENRLCFISVEACEQEIKLITNSDEILSIEAQRKIETGPGAGPTWQTISFDDDVVFVSQNQIGVFWYRFKVIYGGGTEVYTDHLVYTVQVT